MMKTFTAEGGKIEFTVTANVEFEIIPTVDWITLPGHYPARQNM